MEGDCELRLYDPKMDALNSFNLNGEFFSLIEVKLERRDGKQNSRTTPSSWMSSLTTKSPCMKLVILNVFID